MRSRILLATVLSLGLLSAPAEAQTQVVIEAPYASATSRTSCGELVGCLNEAAARKADGFLSATARVAGAHAGLYAMETPASRAEAELVARHKVPDLSGSGREIASITYTVHLDRIHFERASSAHVDLSVYATHAGGAALNPSGMTCRPYGGTGEIPFGGFSSGEASSSTLTATVSGAGGAPIPPGTMDVAVELAGVVVSRHHSVCQGACAGAGVGEGYVDISYTVPRITATFTTRPS